MAMSKNIKSQNLIAQGKEDFNKTIRLKAEEMDKSLDLISELSSIKHSSRKEDETLEKILAYDLARDEGKRAGGGGPEEVFISKTK